MAIKIKKQEYGLAVFNTLNSYSLIVKKEGIPGNLGMIYFMIPSPCKIVRGTKIPVTARDASEYPANLFPINPNYQYTEIGAGLSGFIPEVLLKSSSISQKPVCIDPFDYTSGYNLLQIAHENANLNQQMLIKKLIERCKIMTDSSKVNLINCTLGKAIKRNPELMGASDIVVDYCGPSAYSETEWNRNINTKEKIEKQLKSNVRHLEELLVKPSGHLVTS